MLTSFIEDLYFSNFFPLRIQNEHFLMNLAAELGLGVSG